MQSKYILVSIDDDDDVEEMLTFPLKYSDCRFLELYIEKADVPSFGYHSRFLTQAVQTDSVEAGFAEQYFITAGPSCPIIPSAVMTSPVSSAMVTSPLVMIVVAVLG